MTRAEARAAIAGLFDSVASSVDTFDELERATEPPDPTGSSTAPAQFVHWTMAPESEIEPTFGASSVWTGAILFQIGQELLTGAAASAAIADQLETIWKANKRTHEAAGLVLGPVADGPARTFSETFDDGEFSLWDLELPYLRQD